MSRHVGQISVVHVCLFFVFCLFVCLLTLLPWPPRVQRRRAADGGRVRLTSRRRDSRASHGEAGRPGEFRHHRRLRRQEERGGGGRGSWCVWIQSAAARAHERCRSISVMHAFKSPIDSARAYRADVVPDTLDWTAPELMAEDGHSHVSQASDVPSSPP